MVERNRLALCGMVIACAIPAPAIAQAAAETAVIVSGTTGQAKAGRSLGSAISQSIDSAAGTVRASTRSRTQSPASHRRGSNVQSVSPVIGKGDVLEDTDASAYTVGSGATIKVSRGFRPSATVRCKENCPAEPPDKP